MARRVVLLTGASGLVGTWLRRTVPADVDLVALTHRSPVAGPTGATASADLRDAAAVDAVLERVRPALVLHAAMAVDEASIVDATTHVVRAASAVGAELVHVSTDAVFSGDGRAVDEVAAPDPVWDYGRWKARAEALVLASTPQPAVVRLPLVVSLDPEDRIVERIRRGAVDREPTRWFHDELRQPAAATDLAPALWRIASLPPDERGGVWHLPGPERLSRVEIARRVTEALGLDPGVVVSEPTPPHAGRPRDLDLRADRARTAIGWDPAPVLR